MVEPTRKKNRKAKKSKGNYSGNHQRGWLWGHHAVTETLVTGTWPVNEIYANQKAFDQFSDLLLAKQAAGIPLEIVDNARLEQLSRSSEHQGLVVRLGGFPYQTLESFTPVLRQALVGHASDASPPAEVATSPPLVVICDRLQDTFNFGAILRCCDGANVVAVIVGNRSQAEVTPHVARSSSGAVNHIPIVQVDDLLGTAQFVKDQGMQLIAADSNTKTSVWDSQLRGATALVIGSEATGIQPELLALCDQRVCIPMQGKVTSLNAAVAAGILLYEIRRQQAAPLS
ncbi:putative TrmH family tRNA/rRNA methyltransferase [Novipirellula galeiformis]|uniref:Putative TrmH family tRNA/rRNA methyltransferase n=1 Tax=Novipirellula galeiformis TaxID=2528004 RepID=A0A5C6BZH5_9BACT|nr:23S rRNA (guanosine(2251)-2'-O)-methyltransferase RlmB [Novipirellula galeiformis]TWU17760.1 putative TrmH family tRNA/rRNA methyltransferase [Novipirellula galeiformis]